MCDGTGSGTGAIARLTAPVNEKKRRSQPAFFSVRHRRRGRTLLMAGAAIGLCVAPVGFLGRMTTLLPDLILLGGAAAFLNIQLISWFQQRVDRAVMGRVMSVLMFASVGLLPFSLAIAGVALKASLTGTFLSAGTMILIVILLAASHRAVREID